ncbi:hypothetical protein [Gordonia sp. (in: high G+C Gram-positive bacteria)]|nr:hypothetical protein [Gordonia sp. (in: high G+C Gram-positive bacteria)]
MSKATKTASGQTAASKTVALVFSPEVSNLLIKDAKKNGTPIDGSS